jgi:hypothetical protein
MDYLVHQDRQKKRLGKKKKKNVTQVPSGFEQNEQEGSRRKIPPPSSSSAGYLKEFIPRSKPKKEDSRAWDGLGTQKKKAPFTWYNNHH